MEYPEALVQHFLDAALLVGQFIESFVPLAVIVEQPLNLIEEQKGRGIVYQLEDLPVLPGIPRADLPDAEQHCLFRDNQILPGHLPLDTDIYFMVLHLVPVAVEKDPLQMQLVGQCLLILKGELGF